MNALLVRMCLLLVTPLAQARTSADTQGDWSLPAEERQLPRKMRSAVQEAVCITLGLTNADLLAKDHRALQAVVDYVAELGGGIFLFHGFGAVIDHCTVRGFNGDGINFQQSHDGLVNACVSDGSAGLGLRPGRGSQRAIIQNCVARNNGADGLFLSWRVRHGLFEDNVLEGNGRNGISIGHKDTDNLLRNNQVRDKAGDGMLFRNETLGMAGHRNRLENNLIENNGRRQEAAGIRIRGETRDVVLKNNRIRDTRPADSRKQTTVIRQEENVGPVSLKENTIETKIHIEYQRHDAGQHKNSTP